MSRFVIFLHIAFFNLCLFCVFAIPVGEDDANRTDDNNEAIRFNQPYHFQSIVSELLTDILIDPLTKIITMIGLYLEVFSVASGVHTIVFDKTTTSVSDREQQLIAIASTNLWLKLPMMEKLNDIFTESCISIIPSTANTSISAAAIQKMFEKIEKTILANDSLAPSYKKEKTIAEKLSLPALANGTGNPDFVYEKYPLFREFMVRRQILEHLSAYNPKLNDTSEFQRHVLSQAVLQLSKTAKGDRVQQIFDDAVRITVNKLDPTVKLTKDIRVIDGILFSTLDEKFNTTSDLESEFSEIKKGLIKKYGM